MKNRDRDIGIQKVASSHLLLVILLLASFYFIGKEIILLTSPDPYATELMGKRKAINRTLNCLYRTDALGQTLIMGKQDDFARYEQALTSTLAALDTLKQITTDSVQIYRIERVDTLLQQKSRNVFTLLKTINSRQNIEIYEKNIDKIIAQQDSMLQRQHEQYQILQKQDSLLKKQNPQKFIKRIASAFGNKGVRIETESSDSIEKYTPIDSIVAISQNLKTEIDDSRENLSVQISVQSNRLWHNNQVLNGQIDQLIRDYEQEELSAFIFELEKQQTIRQRAVYVLGIIAVAAIVLALAFLYVISRDLTRSHRYRKELEEANRTAEELLRSREKLMLTITHDFKAPLSSVIGYIDLLERLLRDERQRFYLQNMKQSSQHLLSLVSNLLDFYRLDARKTDVQYLPFVPARLFEEIKNRFIPIAGQKGLQLDYHTDTHTEQTFTGDPLRITQIANNLLSNAIKFTAQGNIFLEIGIENETLHFSVADTGCGMTREEQEKIFQEFTRLGNAQGEEGFGLGLSIVQKLVTLLNGTIHTESQPGKGSRFTVSIPLQSARAALSGVQPESDRADRELRVLLIDDDRIQLELFTAQLQQKGIQAKACWTPGMLYQELRGSQYDLLFTDVQMPGINGFDLLAYLRTSDIPQGRTIPIIAVTARSDMDESLFTEKGFAGCLHKPFSLTEMSDIITRTTGIPMTATLPAAPQTHATAQHPDFSVLTAFSGDDTEAAEQIIETFMQETAENRNRITQAREQKSMKQLSAVAHKMLPVITLLGIDELQEPLSFLEKQGDRLFDEHIDRQTAQLLSLLDTLLEQTRDYKKQNYC